MRDITESGHFYSGNQVDWAKYLKCPFCERNFYHAFRCPESRLDWDKELEAMKED